MNIYNEIYRLFRKKSLLCYYILDDHELMNHNYMTSPGVVATNSNVISNCNTIGVISVGF